jgi:PTH1 family peptidyl-tRNA hydrolase
MALFQKKPQTSDNMPLYTVGLQQTVLIVGLGNIGKKYDGTRHNVGFACVDELAKQQDFTPWIDKKDMRCQVSTGNIGSTRVVLAKPTTLMNLSGEAVQQVGHFYKVTNTKTLLVHDELDLDFGQIRTRTGGSDAGHNGIKSVIKHIGSDFHRVRVGIGPVPEKMDSADFVLARFSKDEQRHLPELIREVNSMVVEFIAGGELTHDTRNFIV